MPPPALGCGIPAWFLSRMKPSPTALLGLGLALAACSQDSARPRQVAQGPAPTSDAPPVVVLGTPTDPTDPLEATNRQVLDLNFKLDDAVFKPAAKAYRAVLGPWPRARIRNVLQNINEPAVAANRLLQGRPVEAGTAVMRFVINSTLGLGGLFDLAPIGGPPRQVADFGQTLAAWGVGDGPYLMVPVLGPSNPRELVGTIGNGLLNPITYAIPFGANIGRGAGEGLDERERNIETIEDIRSNSLDVYARLRSLWRQHRDAELGRATVTEPDVLEDPGAEAPVVQAPAVRRPAPAATTRRQAARKPGPQQARRVIVQKTQRKPALRLVETRPVPGKGG